MLRTDVPRSQHRDPDGRHQIGREQVSQFDGVTRVGFDASRRNQLPGQRMSHSDGSDQWLELIIKQPGIGSRFQDHCIRGGQMVFGPIGERFEAEATWGQDDVLLGVDRSHHPRVVQRDRL